LRVTEFPVREISEAIGCMVSRIQDVINNHSETRYQWRRLVRNKLVPLKLLIPVGHAIHEWSRTYRDLIFEMAAFVARSEGEVTPELIRKFVRGRPRSDIVSTFSESEIGLLMKKSVEYRLPVHRFSLSGATAQGDRSPSRTEKGVLAV
jgi:hypothetical protein